MSIFRLHALKGYRISPDPTWDYINSVIWTGAELAAGVFCASLPAIRQLFLTVLPSRFQKFRARRTQTRSQHDYGGDSGPSLQRQGEDRPEFFVSKSTHDTKKPIGVTTDISATTWEESLAVTSQDKERSRNSTGEPKGFSWNPLRTQPQQGAPSEPSIWKSVDITSSSPTHDDVARRPITTASSIISSRNIGAGTRRTGADDEMELLQFAGRPYHPTAHNGSEDESTTSTSKAGI